MTSNVKNNVESGNTGSFYIFSKICSSYYGQL